VRKREKGQTKLNPSAVPNTFTDVAIWIRIQAAWWLAKEDVAIHKFSSLVEAQLINQGLAPPKSYRNDETAWEIVVILAKYFRGLLRERIQKSPFFGIMIDETTDNSTSQQLILYIKFLDRNADGDYEAVVEYLDLVSPISGVAEDLTVLNNL
jgi:hypothetical protein